MKGKYIKPSELLKLQKETGKSYWDLIGRPLGKKPKDPAKDVVDEYDPVQREALRMQIESALDYPQYKGGKSPKVKTWNDNDIADLIIGFEGFLPHAKDIGDGKITIGSGLTNPKYTRFGTITPEQNRRFVLEEIAARKARLSRNVPGWNTLPGSAKAALLSYDYGWMVDRKTSPKMMKALQDKNWLEVSNQMNAGWNMKKFKKGLRKRRTQERNLFLSDLYRPAPLKPIQTVSPMPEAKVPFEVNQMEDKIAPVVNQQQPIVPYTSTVELPQEYTIPENDMASIDLENTSRVNPNDILQSYYNMFGYKRGKSFPFQFWNRAGNTMRLQRFYRGKNKHDWQWTRVKQTNGKYGYVKTRDDRPIEFSTTTGKFRVYDSPDSNARSFETVKDNTQTTNKLIGIQRTPDDHNAALERDRVADEKVQATTPTIGNFIQTGLAPLNFISPNQIYRGIKDTDNISDFINNVAQGNTGFFTEEYVKGHPYISTAGNLAGDILTGIGIAKTPKLFNIANNWNKSRIINKELNRSIRNSSLIEPTFKPTPRIKLGDVEINNPEIAYRQGNDLGRTYMKYKDVDKSIAQHQIENNIDQAILKDKYKPVENILDRAIENNIFDPETGYVGNSQYLDIYRQTPMYAKGFLWYGAPKLNQILKKGNLQSGLLISPINNDFVVGTPTARAMKNNGIKIKNGVTIATDNGGRLVPSDIDNLGLNLNNIGAYTWVPGYGYKRVVKERPIFQFDDGRINL